MEVIHKFSILANRFITSPALCINKGLLKSSDLTVPPTGQNRYCSEQLKNCRKGRLHKPPRLVLQVSCCFFLFSTVHNFKGRYNKTVYYVDGHPCLLRDLSFIFFLNGESRRLTSPSLIMAKFFEKHC